MFKNLKRLTVGALGVAMVGGLLFGSNLVPYAQTAFNNLRTTAQSSVSVPFQIDAAKGQLAKIGPEIKNMVHQIAKEQVQVNRLKNDLKLQESRLDASYDEMMTLRSHIESGDKFYVATNGKAYNSSRVEEDLRHRFKIYQTAEKTKEKQSEVLAIRQKALKSAIAKLDEAKSQQRELEVQIEHLVARNRMNEVVETASQINIDNSQLAKTRVMLDDLDARISADEEVLNIAPKYYGQIPVNADSLQEDTDILDDMDAYFNKGSEDSVSNESDLKDSLGDDELVLN